MTVLDTSRLPELSTEYEKYPIMAMIQNEEIKKYVKKISTLRQNIIRIYRIIWGQCSQALQREWEEDPDYKTHSTTYDCPWMYTNINMQKSGIDLTSNVY